MLVLWILCLKLGRSWHFCQRMSHCHLQYVIVLGSTVQCIGMGEFALCDSVRILDLMHVNAIGKKFLFFLNLVCQTNNPLIPIIIYFMKKEIKNYINLNFLIKGLHATVDLEVAGTKRRSRGRRNQKTRWWCCKECKLECLGPTKQGDYLIWLE